jgi:uncharacterized SAM-binding protein YcdF (DUF218 family)
MADVFFVLSKLAKALVEPDSLLMIGLGLGCLLLWLGRPKTGRWLLTGCTAVLFAVSALPIGAWWIGALETRFPRPDLASLPPPDGIIVLGGALANPRVSQMYGAINLNQRAERIVEFAMLARRYPEARLLFTGGSGDLRQRVTPESDRLKPFTVDLGIAPGRVEYEERSRNTVENAIYSKELAAPKPGERWLLVTSAAHMPRSVGIFRKLGWDVIPFPVDYETAGAPPLYWFDPVKNWYMLGVAAHETVGLIAYYLAGHTAALFPRPESPA